MLERRDRITCLDVAFASARFAVGRADGIVVVAELKTSEPTAVLRHAAPVRAVTFLDAERLRVECSDGRVEVWRTSLATREENVEVPARSLDAVATTSPDGILRAEVLDGGRLRLSKREGDGWRVLGEPATFGAPATCAQPLDRRLILSGHVDGAVRLTQLGSGGRVVAVTRYGEYIIASREDGLGNRNPGMWSYLMPPPDAAEKMARQTRELATAIVEAMRTPEKERPPAQASPPGRDAVARVIDTLYIGDPEERFHAAESLGESGDRRALVPLERTALHDTGSFTVEGAFVDHDQHVFIAALGALKVLGARIELDDADRARLAGRLAWLGGEAMRIEGIFEAYGAKAREIVMAGLEHPSPMVRVRAHTILGRLDREPAHHTLSLDDDDVRLAATEQDEYTPQLVVAAMKRYSSEPSARVRRGILDLWIRYQRRMATRLDARARAALPFHQDEDPIVRERIARYLQDAR